MKPHRRWWPIGRRDEEAQTSGADTRETSEVLLQVVLPIVLILTYCVLQSARSYIEMVDEMRGKYQQALLELQKQKIIAALETVKSQRRQDLGVTFLSQKKEIRLTRSGRLTSDHAAFREACRRTAQIFRTEDLQTGEKKQLYQRVLKEASLTDARPFEAKGATVDASFAAQTDLAERGEITDANRDFLKKEIEAFLAALKQEVVQLELRVMQAALEIYRNEPLEALYRWNPELARLKKAIVQALNQPGGDPGPHEDSLLRALFRKIREDFEQQGYSFLPEIWETI